MNKAKLPVYYFFGAEDFLIDEAIEKFKRQVNEPSLNLEQLDGRALTLAQLSAALRTQPLLGGDKLVVIKDFELAAEIQDELISFLRALPPGLKVVFSAASLDKRSKLYKFLDQEAEVAEFKTFAPWEQAELAGWVRQRAQQEGKRIADGAARLLTEITGGNLRLLAGELNKLATFAGGRTEITEADVLALAAAGETSAFSLLDALRAKNLKQALTLSQALLKNKEDVFSLLALIAAQCRLMLQLKSLAGREADVNRLARLTGGSPYFIKKCSPALGRFTLAELRSGLTDLLETGLKLKSGAEPTATFDLLLAGLCGD
ncbi:MAG: DNA polymerase III subunit delta [Candidatus Saganbacteria bacterium]|nr:DNA polymerase III subunit delta [Candidatus Saganbacteria bacterium]